MASRRDDRPRHEQIAADLRAKIMAGDLRPGAQLPSTQKLIDQYGGSNTAVTSALTALKTEGFITSHRGKGVYVRERRPFVVRVGTYFTPSPRGYSYNVLAVREVRPPFDVAAVLGLDTEGVAVLRHRLMSYADQPVSLFWSYYPREIAAGTPIAGRAKIVGGAPQALVELGYPQVYFTDRVSARLPTTEELEALELPDDTPVLRQFRTVYAEGDRPVEVSVQIKGAHLYELMYREVIDPA